MFSAQHCTQWKSILDIKSPFRRLHSCCCSLWQLFPFLSNKFFNITDVLLSGRSPIFAAGHRMHIAPRHPHSARQSIILAHPSFAVCEPQDQLAVRAPKYLESFQAANSSAHVWVFCMLEICWKFPNLL